jgi:hypothetical protein
MDTNLALTPVEKIPGLIRFENVPKDAMQEACMEMTHAVYSHDETYGDFCTIERYIDCPPEQAFTYLADPVNLLEWTYSLRDLKPTEDKDVLLFTDAIGGKTKCYCRTESNAQAMTVDYHCAWDQGKVLWMIYLMRVIPAPLVFNKPGSVVLWTNCRHPYYDKNPFPEQSPEGRKVWVGDMWPMFYAGHSIEMDNLKNILEYRHRQQQR